MAEKKRGRAVVDYSQCMACGICVQACPFSNLELGKSGLDRYNKAYPVLIVEEECRGCGICKEACPLASIQISV